MIRRIAVCVVLVAVAGSLFAAPAPVAAKKRESIRTLLELTGMAKVADQMIGQMFDSFSKNVPSVPPEVWDRMKKKMKADDLIELLTPVYDKYYTQEDLDGMIAFYRTPLGQKVVRTLPDVSREGFEIGQAWGKQKGEEVIKELRSEGLIK